MDIQTELVIGYYLSNHDKMTIKRLNKYREKLLSHGHFLDVSYRRIVNAVSKFSDNMKLDGMEIVKTNPNGRLFKLTHLMLCYGDQFKIVNGIMN